mgnify:FL=1
MKETNKTNSYLKVLASDLYKLSSENKSNIWKRVADDLMVPTREKKLVNLFKIDMYAKDGDVIVVPGKVLGTGDINKKITVSAFSFSKSAVEKIKGAKGSVISLHELIQKNPKGKDVRLMV